MGVEPTKERMNAPSDGFEDRGAHRDPYTSLAPRVEGAEQV